MLRYVDLPTISKVRVSKCRSCRGSRLKTSSASQVTPLHFMSAEGCIGVAHYGTIDDKFDNVA